MIEILEKFTNEKSFREWSKNHPINVSQLNGIAKRILDDGIVCDFFGEIKSGDISITGSNLRECLIAKNLNSRQRAVLELLVNESKLFLTKTPKIYAPEAITELSSVLRQRYPYFLGSEYAPDPLNQARIYPIEHQNLLDLNLRSNSFDAIITCDVLEHLTDIPRSLSEIARVLKPDGVMLSTFPFTWKEESLIKATFENKKINHILEPEYHGNPVDPEGGSLVFTIPGFEIVNWCITSGFSKAEIIVYASEKRGIIASAPPFINILRAYK